MNNRTTAVYASDLSIDIHQKEISASIGKLHDVFDSSSIVVVYSAIELFINVNIQAIARCASIEEIYSCFARFCTEEGQRWGYNYETIQKIYGKDVALSRYCLDFEALPERIRELLARLATLNHTKLQSFTYRGVPVGAYSIQDYSYIYKNIQPKLAIELNAYRLLILACCIAIDNFLSVDLSKTQRVIYFNDYCWHMSIRSIAENNYKATAICISNSVSSADRSQSIQIRPRHLIEMQLISQHSWKLGLNYLPLRTSDICKIRSRLDSKLKGTHFTSFTPPVAESKGTIKSVRALIDTYRNAFLFLTSSPDEASGLYELYKGYRQVNRYRDETIPAFNSSQLQEDLIVDFVNMAQRKPRDLFIIRVHPRDGACARYNIKSNSVMEIISKLSASNLVVFGADSNVNTYLLSALCSSTFTGWSSTCLELNMLGLPSFALVKPQIPLLNTPPEFILNDMKDHIESTSHMPGQRLSANYQNISRPSLERAIIAYRWHACLNFMFDNLSAAVVSESLNRLKLLPRKSWALPILKSYYISHEEALKTEEYDMMLKVVEHHWKLLKESIY